MAQDFHNELQYIFFRPKFSQKYVYGRMLRFVFVLRLPTKCTIVLKHLKNSMNKNVQSQASHFQGSFFIPWMMQYSMANI